MVKTCENESFGKTEIYNPILLRLSDVNIGNDVLAHIFKTTWELSEIFMTQKEAEEMTTSFHPENTFVLIDKENNRAIGQIHTVSVKLGSIEELIETFTTYKEVEIKAHNAPVKDANVMLCFSINCPMGYRIKITSGETQSMARTIIESLPQNIRKVTYSFMNMHKAVATSKEMVKQYFIYLRDGQQKLGGPVFMHQFIGDAPAIAFLGNSRPNHIYAGEGNVLNVYPNNPTEAKIFREIITNRCSFSSTDKITYIDNFNNVSIFRDIKI